MENVYGVDGRRSVAVRANHSSLRWDARWSFQSALLFYITSGSIYVAKRWFYVASVSIYVAIRSFYVAGVSIYAASRPFQVAGLSVYESSVSIHESSVSKFGEHGFVFHSSFPTLDGVRAASDAALSMCDQRRLFQVAVPAIYGAVCPF